jgi:hypothetical protein
MTRRPSVFRLSPSIRACVIFGGIWLASSAAGAATIEFPLERSAYFVGELAPVALGEGKAFRLEAVGADGPTLLYEGPSPTVLIDTSQLAAGDYQLRLNGEETKQRFTVTGTLARSAGSMQDESGPAQPQFDPKKKYTPKERAALVEEHWNGVVRTLEDSGLSAVVSLGQADVHREPTLDVLARAGVMLLANPDTRPTSFFPLGNDPAEQDSMSQRVILGAQANGRYPNFAGFCFGWDTTGYAINNRRGLLTYWGWGNKTEALRHYIRRVDKHTQDEFQRRTGLQAVSEVEYISYLLSIKRPEFATAIDLPTLRWLEEIAQYTKPMSDVERTAFEKRLDAWSAYLMGLYAEGYGAMARNLRAVDPTLRNTASVQVDHAPVRYGQYFPSAYAPLDLQYQSTWNDQVGGPDYAYQWLLVAGLLDMQRAGKPTWLSNAMATAHDRARYPGKMVRVAAHGLPWGVSGIGFALEGFSNLLGGMNRGSTWPAIKGHAGEADVKAGREFLDRFAVLALEGRGDHGVGILFSKSQFQRQHVVMGFGTSAYQAFVSLTRLGYTPRFVTEEELAEQQGKLAIRALLVIGQTFPLPDNVSAAIDAFAKRGGRVLVDDNTTAAVPGSTKLGYAFALSRPGKPHNWATPSITAGDNDALMAARWHEEIAPPLAKALGETGRGIFQAEKGAASNVSLLQIDGGADAKYVLAVNDSHVGSQADWFQVRETIVPVRPSDALVFDCTAEQALGKLTPLSCDLTKTTARVYAVLARQPAKIDLRASQNIAAGAPLLLSARFLDPAGKPLAALVPVCLTVTRPDGKTFAELYRCTDRAGRFALSLPIPANVPPGKWSVGLRSQLNGQAATLSVNVAAAANDQGTRFAVAYKDPVFVRQGAAAEQALAKGAKFVLPIFDSPAAEKLLPVAEKVKQVLAARGVEVDIRVKPSIGTYWLAYELTPEQARENALVDRSEKFGRIKRETANGNDWFSGQSGWRFGQPLILLDLAAEKGDNPPAETLAGAGILWPDVTAGFPGAGRAVVEAVPWAFAPRTTTIVIRAEDVPGLMKAAAALAKLPADRLTPRIESVRAELWRQHYVGPRPAPLAEKGLSADGLQTAQAPRPFAIDLAGAGPPAAGEVSPPARPAVAAVALPATFEPKQFVVYVRDRDAYVESATAGFLVPDTRFHDAIQLAVEVKEPGKHKVRISGVFRYSDRKPCWQAQWEDLIELREKLVPKERRPLTFEARLDGKPAAELKPSKVETKDVPLELASSSAGLKPRTANEEVVTELTGEIELPAGRHDLLLIHHNVVDGRIEKIEITR